MDKQHSVSTQYKKKCGQILKQGLPQIQKTIQCYAHEPFQVAEITQEVMIKVFRFMPSYQGKSPLSTWIHRLTINTIYNYFSRQKILQSFDDGKSYALDKANNPDDWLARTETGLEIKAMIEGMPLKYAKPYCMYYFDNGTYLDIAHAMHCPIGTVRSRIHRAKKILKAGLGKQL